MNRRLSRRGFVGAIGAFGLPLNAKAAEAYTMRLTLPNPADSFEGLTAFHLAAAVARRSNGQMKIDVYPNGQLIKELDVINGLASGVVDLAFESAAQMVPLFPRCEVISMPFLFRSLEAAYRVVDGPIGNEFLTDFESKGIIGFGWGSQGFKELETAPRPIVVPEDMKGLRIRIQNGALQVATYQALGAIPVVIDPSETFLALSQHTIDGVEFGLDTFVRAKHYTVAKYVAMSNHVLAGVSLIASKRKIGTLPPALQKILLEEGKLAVSFWRTPIARQNTENTQFLKKNGVTFTEIQYPVFRKAMDPVYATFQSKFGGDFLARVIRATNAT
jgi:TRAP-type transport system periplasmic protein